MTNNRFVTHKPGLGYAAAYQVSGRPFITGSGGVGLANGDEVCIQFPSVTKSVTVICTVGQIRVHFASSTEGLTIEHNHFITLSASGSYGFDVKCKQIYISNASGQNAGYQLGAEITSIPAADMFHLSGSGITGRHSQ